ncbi:MAG: Fis family transcriptional regulator [Cyanobacteriota bacterium]|nr:Fis family transcriptional regulator [Cyanobacteriota bacterium]
MTSNFDARESSRQDAAKEMDSLQRDRFELLSAFIDGEVTAAERSQVQQLLATNADMQRLYSRLMKLRQEVQKLPVPASEATAQETAQQVFSKIDRRRVRQTVLWGGAALAAVFVSALSGIFPGSQSLLPQIAQGTKQEAASEPLMIAVNRPIIEISKAPVASPEKFLQPAVGDSNDTSNFN